MRAVVLQGGALELVDAADPTPGPGEAVVRTLAAGICGTDLHCVRHTELFVASSRAVLGYDLMDLARPVVLGHEFCAEVLDSGGRFRAGTRVVCPPFLVRQSPAHIGFSGLDTPGSYAERMVLTEGLLLAVPNGLATETAALTEPLAVGLHAVGRSGLGPHDVPLVVGCGPIGLAVIAVLRMRGAQPIVAVDFSARRRELATTLGAHVVVDPAEQSPYAAWREVAATDDVHARAPSTALFQGLRHRPAVIFECAGVPGVIQQVLAGAPAGARIVVAGLCLQTDTFEPAFGLLKEVDVRFALMWSVREFARTLRHLAEGDLVADAIVTGKVGLADVAEAFADLASPERHAKVLIDPSLG